MRSARALVALAAAAAALAVPLAVLAGGHAGRQAPPTFSFGRSGGNIVPFTVKVRRDGAVVSSGPVTLVQPGAVLSDALRNGLVTLARAEGFFTTMPASIRCAGVLPDVAARFVTIAATGKRRTVTARGACNAPFEELYAVLYAAAGLR